MILEFWVMRVLLHPGPMRRPVRLADMTPATHLATMMLVNTGELCCMPDGCIAEPVEQYKDQEAAHAAREKLMADNPGADYRVAINTDVKL